MKRRILKIIGAIFIGIVFSVLSLFLESTYLHDFLADNLIPVLLALMAINSATIGVIGTKLRDIINQERGDFSRSIRSMKMSLIEQVVFVIIAATTLTMRESPIVLSLWTYMAVVLDALLISILALSVQILYDTANGIFLILDYENSKLVE